MDSIKLYIDILNKIHRLKKLKKRINEDELEVLLESIDILNSFITKEVLVKETLDEIITEEFQYFEKYKFLLEIGKTLASYTTDESVRLPKTNTHFNKSELVTLVHDFYKNATSKKIYESYISLSKKRPYFTSTKSTDCHADSIYLPFDSSFFTRIKLENDFSDISTLAHEYGHGIALSRKYDARLFSTLSPFIEIVATFFELLSLEYYSKDQTLFKDAIATKYMFFDETIKDARLLKSELLLLYNPLEEYNEALKDIILSMSSLNFPYIIGYSFAIELFKTYQKDPDYAFYILEKIMEINTKLAPKEYLKALYDLGLRPNSSTTNYQKHLKRELTRL